MNTAITRNLDIANRMRQYK